MVQGEIRGIRMWEQHIIKLPLQSSIVNNPSVLGLASYQYKFPHSLYTWLRFESLTVTALFLFPSPVTLQRPNYCSSGLSVFCRYCSAIDWTKTIEEPT